MYFDLEVKKSGKKIFENALDKFSITVFLLVSQRQEGVGSHYSSRCYWEH